MLLSPLERILILGALPEKNTIDKIRLGIELRAAISFSEDEIEKWNIQNDGQRITWSDDAEDVEIEIGKPKFDLIAESLTKANKAGQITEQHVSLWDKFVDITL